MTNLSDLLPAGAASKQLSFTADGAIASGQTVALQSNGTVKAISSSAAGVGSEVVFESANTQQIGMTYDTTNDKVVIVYRDGGNSDYGTAVVGTVSGKTISFGTPVVFESGSTIGIGMTFDTNSNKVLLESYNNYKISPIKKSNINKRFPNNNNNRYLPENIKSIESKFIERFY